MAGVRGKERADWLAYKERADWLAYKEPPGWTLKLSMGDMAMSMNERLSHEEQTIGVSNQMDTIRTLQHILWEVEYT